MAPLATEETDFCALFLLAILSNGWFAFPLPRGTKRTFWRGWKRFCRTRPTEEQVARWLVKYASYGLALACGYVCFAVDIDEEDEARAEALQALVFSVLGPTPLIRVGKWPRRVLIYRVLSAPVASRRWGPAVELIGKDRYVVGYNLHADTGLPYTWLNGGPNRHNVADIPAPSPAQIAAVGAAVAAYDECGASPSGSTSPSPALLDKAEETTEAVRRSPSCTPRRRVRRDARWIVDDDGRVVDHREAFLAACVYHFWALGHSGPEALAGAAWTRFVDNADLRRPRRDGGRSWRYEDALLKARKLLNRGLLRPTSRPACRVQDGVWTSEQFDGFRHHVDALGALGWIPRSSVVVSRAMASLAQRSGVCFASTDTLAETTGYAVRTVKQARQTLVSKGLWEVANKRGGRALGAEYRPCMATLATRAAP